MSKLKVVSIQHPDAVNPSIELAADGSISIDKVPAGDVNVTPVGSITAENVQAALEELDTNVAADINVTPTGGITAENVQAALEELDTNVAAGNTTYSAIGATLARVNHGTDPSVPRPIGYAAVQWYGSVEPNNWVNGDEWIEGVL
ncbi:MAG: hypothetical protein WD061_00090 [Candidatus Saccharimonadales bacterium]